MQVHLVFAHGNPGGLVPPGGGGTIFANDVRDAVPGSEPSTKQAMIGACNAGSTEAFLKAYLREGEPSTTNRFVTGFSRTVSWQVAEIFFRSLVGLQVNDGLTAEESVERLRELFPNPSDVQVYGDPNARLKWLYDGTPGARPGIWKVAP